MATNYDGSVVIRTALETDGFTAGSQDLKRAAEEAASKIDNISAATRASIDKQVRSFGRLNDAYSQQEDYIEALRAEYEELSQTQVESDEYANLISQIQKYEAALERAEQKAEKIKALDANRGVESTRAYQAMQEKMSMYVEQLEQAEKKRDGILLTSKNAVAEYERENAAVEKLKRAIDDLAQKMEFSEQLFEKQQENGSNAYQAAEYDVARLRESLDGLIDKRRELEQSGGAYVSADTTGVENRLTAAEEKHNAMLEKLNDNYLTLRDRIMSVGKEGEKAHKAVAKHTGISFKKVLQYGFGIRSVFVLFRKLRSAAKESLGIMAQYDPQLNGVISKFMTGAKQLKADIGTLIQPLVQKLAPIVTALLDRIHDGIIGISQFFAALVGQDYIEVAKVATVDWAGALNDVADASERVNDSLGSYDKLQMISGTAEADAKATKNNMQLTKDTVKYVKQSLDESKWYVRLGRKLSGVFQEALDWIKKKLEDPEEFLKTLGITLLGIKLGKMLLGGVASSGFGSGVLGLIPKIATIAVTAYLGYKIGQKIFESLPEGLQDELGKQVFDVLLELGFIDEDGNPVDLDEALENLKEKTNNWIKKNTKQGKAYQAGVDVRNFLKDLFTGNLESDTEGIIDRSDLIGTRKPKVIIEPEYSIAGMPSDVRERMKREEAEKRKKVFDTLKGVWASFTFQTAIGFEKKWNITPTQWFEGIRSSLTSAWNTPGNPVKAGLDFVKNSFNTLTGGVFAKPKGVTGQDVTNFFAGIGNTFKSIWGDKDNPVKATFNTIKTGFKSSISSMISIPGDGLTPSQKLAMKLKWEAIGNNIKEIWDAKDNPVKKAFTTIKSGLSSLWNSVFGTGDTDGKSIIDAVTNGLNAVSGAADKNGSSLNTALLNVGKKISEGINKGTISVPVTFTGKATPAGAGSQATPKINTTVTITLDGKTISKTVIDEAAKVSKQIGSGAAAKLHYVIT